jgi:CRISPR system Cascade subunit CasD
MKALVLTLQGHLRSWGGMSLGDNRETLLHPTASALIGLLGACAGIDRHNAVALDAWYQAWDCMSLTAHRSSTELPSLLLDFQTARCSLNTSGKTITDAVISHRGYLQDTIDVAALALQPHADPALLELALAGIRTPVYTPYLGRISNPFSALPWLPDRDILVEGEAAQIAAALVERMQYLRTVEKVTPALRGKLFAPSGWLGNWSEGRFAYRTGIPDRRLGAPLSYGQRMVDLFYVEREEMSHG